MAQDVELMRELMFLLEARELSPRATVVISLDDEAPEIGFKSEDVAEGLNRLLDLDYIDGPGQDEPGFWLFRQLTRKGRNFLRATRRPDDWERMKRHFASQDRALGA